MFTTFCIVFYSVLPLDLFVNVRLSDSDSITLEKLLLVWPLFDTRKDVADGRKEGFNVFVQGQLDLSWGLFHLSPCFSH